MLKIGLQVTMVVLVIEIDGNRIQLKVLWLRFQFMLVLWQRLRLGFRIMKQILTKLFLLLYFRRLLHRVLLQKLLVIQFWKSQLFFVIEIRFVKLRASLLKEELRRSRHEMALCAHLRLLTYRSWISEPKLSWLNLLPRTLNLIWKITAFNFVLFLFCNIKVRWFGVAEIVVLIRIWNWSSTSWGDRLLKLFIHGEIVEKLLLSKVYTVLDLQGLLDLEEIGSLIWKIWSLKMGLGGEIWSKVPLRRCLRFFLRINLDKRRSRISIFFNWSDLWILLRCWRPVRASMNDISKTLINRLLIDLLLDLSNQFIGSFTIRDLILVRVSLMVAEHFFSIFSHSLYAFGAHWSIRGFNNIILLRVDLLDSTKFWVKDRLIIVELDRKWLNYWCINRGLYWLLKFKVLALHWTSREDKLS